MRGTLEERFWDKVEKGPNCWIWRGTKADSRGYGLIRGNDGKRHLTHRIAYELAHGEIPEGKWVLHTCDNPSCVNPKHLFIGTSRDNINDMVRKRRSLSGEKDPNSRLTWNLVRQIRKRYQNGETEPTLAKRYRISQAQVNNIIRARQWKERRTHMRCINCKSEETIKDYIEVMHQGVEIGVVCDKCLFGVEALRLFVRRQKNGTMALVEMQVIPNPTR